MAGAGAVDGVPSGHAITVYPWLQIALADLPARADHPDVVFWGDVYDVSWTVGFHEKARDMRSPAITGNCATIVVENRTALDERDRMSNPPAASAHRRVAERFSGYHQVADWRASPAPAIPGSTESADSEDR